MTEQLRVISVEMYYNVNDKNPVPHWSVTTAMGVVIPVTEDVGERIYQKFKKFDIPPKIGYDAVYLVVNVE